MKKVEVKNPLNIDIFINGTPDVNRIPDELIKILSSMLEVEVFKLIDKSEQKKNFNQACRGKSQKSPL